MVTKKRPTNAHVSSVSEGQYAQFSTVSLKEILSGPIRLDASYYDIKFRKARDLLGACKSPLLPLYDNKGFSNSAFYPGRFKRIFVDRGIPIFTASQMLDLEPRAEKQMSPKTKVDAEILKLKIGQLIMTRSGTIGDISLVSEGLKNKVFSDDVIRIEFDNEQDMGYVYAFLKTSIGQQILKHNKYGSVIKHIEPDHLRDLLIPNPPDTMKEDLNKSVQKVLRLKDQAMAQMEESRKRLADLLWGKEFESKTFQRMKSVDFTEKASNLDDRLDASYHVPIYKLIEKSLESTGFEITTVGDTRISKKIILPGRFKRVYVGSDNGTPFLSGGDIMQFIPSHIKFLSTSYHRKRIERQLRLRANMILVTCSGTIGNVIIVPSHLDGWTANQHILRVTPSDSVNPGFLFAYLGSEVGRFLIKRWSYGSVVQEIDSKQISQVKIPILPADKQSEIGNPALEAAKNWSEAFNLERATVRRIEDLVGQHEL